MRSQYFEALHYPDSTNQKDFLNKFPKLSENHITKTPFKFLV